MLESQAPPRKEHTLTIRALRQIPFRDFLLTDDAKACPDHGLADKNFYSRHIVGDLASVV
jgi:hypothetical protein